MKEQLLNIVEKYLGKRRISPYKAISHFDTMFSKSSAAEASECFYMTERIKIAVSSPALVFSGTTRTLHKFLSKSQVTFVK